MFALSSIFWFVLVAGILVAFHEWGHFWVARRFGVKIIRYSIGMGRVLWRRKGSDGTEFALSAIPLGGYVRFADAKEDVISQADLPRLFNAQALWKRVLIILAGPVANLVFCVAAFWLMFMLGINEPSAVIGKPSGLAAKSDFQAGDEILRVNGAVVAGWNQWTLKLIEAAQDRKLLQVEVRTAQNQQQSRVLDLRQLPPLVDEFESLDQIGFHQKGTDDPILSKVAVGSPAEVAGLRAGDRIRKINAVPIESHSDIREYMSRLNTNSAAPELRIAFERPDSPSEMAISVTPRLGKRDQNTYMWQLGIAPPIAKPGSIVFKRLHFGPLEAFAQAIATTKDHSISAMGMIWRLISGKATLKNNLSGPLTMGVVAAQAATQGPSALLEIMALISLSLCIMNLLPIPVLDGGRLLFYVVEWLKGSPLSDRAQEFGQMAGLSLILGLMGLAFYFDFTRNF
jgi:regulator of sigma E protease